MSASNDPYSRLYWRLSDEFPDVYDDAETLGTFMQLLVAAEQAWPTRQKFPADAKPAVVDRLVSAGLVIAEGRRFTVKGLDKERQERSDAARYAVNKRWENARNTDGNTPRNTESIPSKAEQSRDKQSTTSREDADGIFDAYYRLTTRPPSPNVIAWLNRLTDEHGEHAVVIGLAAEYKADPDPSTLLGRVQTKLADQARHADKAAEKRRGRAAIEEIEALRDAMPEEQRAANLVRLRDEMAARGLV